MKNKLEKSERDHRLFRNKGVGKQTSPEEGITETLSQKRGARNPAHEREKGREGTLFAFGSEYFIGEPFSGTAPFLQNSAEGISQTLLGEWDCEKIWGRGEHGNSRPRG